MTTATLNPQDFSSLTATATKVAKDFVNLTQSLGSVSGITSHLKKQMAKIYGLMGYTRYCEVEIDSERFAPGHEFVFENHRYRVVNVISNEPGQYLVNAVALEKNQDLTPLN